jgi:transposase-like protein
LGVAAQTVHNWLVTAGVPGRPNPATTRADISDEQIIRLYTGGGYTAGEIADRLGCSPSLVYARLVGRGIAHPPRAPHGRVRPTHAKLAHLYREGGLSLRDLAGRYRVSRQAVHRWLVAAGVDRPPRRRTGRPRPHRGPLRGGLVGPGDRRSPGLLAVDDLPASRRRECRPPAGHPRPEPPRPAPSVGSGTVGTGDRRHPWGQRVLRVSRPGPSTAHDQHPGRQATTTTPVLRVLPQPHHLSRYQRERERQRSTLRDSPNFSLTLTPLLTCRKPPYRCFSAPTSRPCCSRSTAPAA